MTRRHFFMVAAGAALYPTRAEDLLDNVRTRAEWERRREKIRANMELVMGPLPAGRKLPVDVQEVERVEHPTYTRTKITFLSEADDRVPAYLLVPKGRKGPTPALLCLHQTTRLGKGEPAGLGDNVNLQYARELAQRGYVTLAPDYPNFGEYTFDPYQRGYASATMKGIWNHMRAVDVLQSLAQVARDRIGCIGHSLGGHNTLFVGVFDLRIKAMVTSCGFTSFRKYYGGDLSGWSHKGYMPRIAERYGKDPARMPFDFSEVLAALAPRPVFINAPVRDANFDVSGVRDCVAAAVPIYARVFGARDRLVAAYPDAGHDFPPPVRQSAYAFLDKWLLTAP